MLASACSGSAPPAVRVPGPLGPRAGEVRVLAPPMGGGSGALPVVYFLHDYWGSDAVLWQHGIAQRLAAREQRGELPPFLLVAPAGDHDFWNDSWDGRRRYDEWLRVELPAWVESHYAVRPGRCGRAWVGISMGGLGAVDAALRRARETAAAVSISGLLVPLDRAFVRGANVFLRRSLRRVFGPGPDDAALRQADPYRLLATLDAVPAGERPRLLLLAGDRDKYRLQLAAKLFAGLAREKGLTTELRLSPGGHDWGYWRSAAEEGIGWAVRELQECAKECAS